MYTCTCDGVNLAVQEKIDRMLKPAVLEKIKIIIELPPK